MMTQSSLPPPLLTLRQVTIFEMVANGQPQHLIADKLSYAESTVKRDINSVKETLGVSTVPHAVAILVGSGIIQPKISLRLKEELESLAQMDTLEPDWVKSLTKRQREIFEALAHAPTNTELTAELNISSNTLRVHLRGIYKALGIDGDHEEKRSRLIQLAQRISGKERSHGH